jgi:hypothetical protein
MHELLLTPSWLRRAKGDQFTLTLIVNLSRGQVKYLDLYLDRILDGKEGLVYSGTDGSKTFRTSARLRPDSDKTFDVDVIFDVGTDTSMMRPVVRVPRDFAERLREIQEQEVVQELLRELGMDGD